MSELRNRLERLAARGNRRGADDVLAAAQRGAPREEIGMATDFDGPDLPRADDDLVPFVTTEPDARRRSRYGTVVAAFGIAALLGVGMLAITSIFGNGGASSPEGAVRQLADAVSHKDPLAAVDVLSPTEIRSARQTVNDATNRAADLKIVDNASQPLAGVDLSVDNLKLSTQTLADGYAKVTITSGDITASTHTAAMSKLLQSAIKNSGNAPGKVDLARLASDSNLPTFVMTVRHDGRWYVSPAYTALEYAREVDGGPPAEFGSAAAKAATLGSDTPDNAVGDALHVWQAGNWDRLMALAPPDELPVYDYRAWIEQSATDTHPDFTVDNLNTTSTVSGDTATVKLQASGTTGSGSDKGKWQVGGTCPTETIGDGSVSSLEPATGVSVKQIGENGGGSYSSSSAVFTSNAPSICLSGDLGQSLPFGLFPFDSANSTPATGSISIKVVRENGRWFVSPVSTVLDAVDSAIQHVDQRTVYTLLGLAYQLPPDGNITLNQPFSVPAESGLLSSSVFAFDGTKGQHVIGESSGGNDFASGEIYTADGKDVGYVDFPSKGSGFGFDEATALPVTGSYRLVISSFATRSGTLTLWDAKDAPKGLIAPDSGFSSGSSGEICTTKGTTTSCSEGSPQTYPVTPDQSSGAATASPCSIKNNALVCAGEASIAICPATGSNAAGDCIPRSLASGLAGLGATGSSGGTSSSSGSGSNSQSVTATTSPVTPTSTVGTATSVP